MSFPPNTTIKPLVKLPKNPDGCWLWQGAFNDKGLPMKQWNGKPVAARRWLWEQLFGLLPKALNVYSTCGDLRCVNPQHMTSGTSADRNRSAVAKLMPADVAEIKRRKGCGRYERVALAIKFDISDATLQDIWAGRSWKPQNRRFDSGAEA